MASKTRKFTLTVEVFPTPEGTDGCYYCDFFCEDSYRCLAPNGVSHDGDVPCGDAEYFKILSCEEEE